MSAEDHYKTTSATCFKCSRETTVHLNIQTCQNEWGLPTFLPNSLPYHYLIVSPFFKMYELMFGCFCR